MDLQLEELSNDIIDEEFSRIFYGLQFIQRIIGRLTLKIKYGFATAPSQWYFIYSTAVFAIYILFTVGYILKCELVNDALVVEFYMNIGHIIDIFLVLKTFIQGFSGSASCELYVKLHKIDHYLNFNGKQSNRNLAKYVTIFSIGFGLHSLVGTGLYGKYAMKESCPFVWTTPIPEAASCLDVATFTVIIYYIANRVSYINTKLEAIESNTQNEITSGEGIILGEHSCSLDTILWNQLLVGMKSILTVINDLVELYKYQILSFTVQLLLWVMIAIQSCIFKIQNQIPITNLLVSVICTLSLIFMKVIMLTSCMAANLLSKKIEKSRNICVSISHKFVKGITRRNAKHMLLLLDSKCELSIYDIYTLHPRLSLKLLAIIATYTIVLLQFALETPM